MEYNTIYIQGMPHTQYDKFDENWLERNKHKIIDKIYSDELGNYEPIDKEAVYFIREEYPSTLNAKEIKRLANTNLVILATSIRDLDFVEIEAIERLNEELDNNFVILVRDTYVAYLLNKEIDNLDVVLYRFYDEYDSYKEEEGE